MENEISVHGFHSTRKTKNSILILCRCVHAIRSFNTYSYPRNRISPVSVTNTRHFFLSCFSCRSYTLLFFCFHIVFCIMAKNTSWFFCLLTAMGTNVCARYVSMFLFLFFGMKYRLEKKHGSCCTSVAVEYIDLCIFFINVKCMDINMWKLIFICCSNISFCRSLAFFLFSSSLSLSLTINACLYWIANIWKFNAQYNQKKNDEARGLIQQRQHKLFMKALDFTIMLCDDIYHGMNKEASNVAKQFSWYIFKYSCHHTSSDIEVSVWG